MTANEIRLGLIVSKTSPLGSETFSGPMYGALAYFSSLNDRGGINGRMVKVTVCDDNATGAGNRRCARQLIEDDKVMAFVSNSVFDYSAASYVNDNGVPDIGGQPISTVYEQYQHLFTIYGSSSPRDGVVGIKGKLDGGTEVYRYFKQELGAGTAGVVYYNQNESQRFADLTAAALEVEGYTVVREQVDFSVPNFDAAAIDMRSRGVDIVFDAMDTAGNVRLCEAMDGAGLTVKAKVVTVQSWAESVRTPVREGIEVSQLDLRHGHHPQLHGRPVPGSEPVPRRHEAATTPNARTSCRCGPRRGGPRRSGSPTRRHRAARR